MVECPRHDTKSSNDFALVMKGWRMWRIPVSLLLSGPV